LTLLAQEGDTPGHADFTHPSQRLVVAHFLLKERALAGQILV
jgi:hypothetical protein